MTNSFHLQHCFYLWITCFTCILYLDDCQTTTVLCHEGVLQRNQTCHDKKHEIALHGAAHKNHLNWQSNLSLLNTWATKTIHFNEITPLPLSEITISKFMSIWEYQSQWCVIEIMTFPVKKEESHANYGWKWHRNCPCTWRSLRKGNLQGKEADSYNREAANEAMTTALLGHTQHSYCWNSAHTSFIQNWQHCSIQKLTPVMVGGPYINIHACLIMQLLSLLSS